MKRNLTGLIKLAQGLDPTENFLTYNNTPTAPAAYTSTDRNATPTPQQVYYTMKNVNMDDVSRLYRAGAAVPFAIAAGPYAANGIRSAAGSLWHSVRQNLPYVPHIAGELMREAGKTIWTGGSNLIAYESPLLQGIGYLYRTASNVGPVAWWLKQKYGITADKLAKLYNTTTKNLHSVVDKAKSSVQSLGAKRRSKPIPNLQPMVTLSNEEIDELE